MKTYFKLYSACRHCHSPIEAILELMDCHSFKASSIQEIIVFTYSIVFSYIYNSTFMLIVVLQQISILPLFLLLNPPRRGRVFPPPRLHSTDRARELQKAGDGAATPTPERAASRSASGPLTQRGSSETPRKVCDTRRPEGEDHSPPQAQASTGERAGKPGQSRCLI